MKKRLIIALAAILAVSLMAATFVACTNSSPEAVIKAYVKAFNDRDAGKAVDCFYFETDAEKTAAKTLIEMSFGFMEDEEKLETRNFKTEIDGDTATVTFEGKEGDGEWSEDSIKVIKKNGKWYLDYAEMFGGLGELES